MSTTYTQKQAPTQKKDAPSAASVLDSSSQNEGLQRKAALANNAVIQQIRFTHPFEVHHVPKGGLYEESGTYSARSIPRNDILTPEAYRVLERYSAGRSWLCIHNVPSRRWDSSRSFTSTVCTVWVSAGNAWHLGPTVWDNANQYQHCDYINLIDGSNM